VPLEDYMSDPEKRTVKNGVRTIPYILNVSKGNLDRYIRDNFDEITQAVRDSGILIGNLGWIEAFRDAGIKVYGDYGLNVYNEQARRAYEDEGVELYMPSHETDISDRRGIPCMITEHHVDSAYLTDHKGAKHRVVTAASGDKTLIY
jgi:putative protease